MLYALCIHNIVEFKNKVQCKKFDYKKEREKDAFMLYVLASLLP